MLEAQKQLAHTNLPLHYDDIIHLVLVRPPWQPTAYHGYVNGADTQFDPAQPAG
jgi:hypothetical protein